MLRIFDVPSAAHLKSISSFATCAIATFRECELIHVEVSMFRRPPREERAETINLGRSGESLQLSGTRNARTPARSIDLTGDRNSLPRRNGLMRREKLHSLAVTGGIRCNNARDAREDHDEWCFIVETSGGHMNHGGRCDKFC